MAGLGQRLEIRQGQGLVMTPQLQQAIKLLQLSNIELTAYCEQELERNPLLERDESASAPERDDVPETNAKETTPVVPTAPNPDGELGGHGSGSGGAFDAGGLHRRSGDDEIHVYGRGESCTDW